MAFSLSIGPRASVHEFGITDAVNRQETILAQIGNHTSTQVLTLDKFRLDLWDVIILVKSLPLLSDLRFSSLVIGPMPTGVIRDKLPAFICSRYAPVGKQLRYIHILSESPPHLTDTLFCVLLLVLACPNFDYCVYSVGLRERYVKEVQEIIKLHALKQCAPRMPHIRDSCKRHYIF